MDLPFLKNRLHQVYDMLYKQEKDFQKAHPFIITRYKDSLSKISQDLHIIKNAVSLDQAHIPFLQFQGKSKMTMGLLRCLHIPVDEKKIDDLLKEVEGLCFN